VKHYLALAALVAVTTVLSACSERVVYLTPEEANARTNAQINEEKARLAPIQSRLPPGCEFRDLGRYDPGFAKPWIYVTAVFCGKTVTTQSSWRSGKTQHDAAVTTNVE
jgi:hypothetical protein